MTVGAVSLSIRPASHISRRRGMAGLLKLGGPLPYMVASARIEGGRPCELVVNAIERLLTALKEPK